MKRSDTAQQNRAAMPHTARLVDAYRNAFGPGLRVVHAVESGIELGRPSTPARAMTADQWLHYLRTGELPCSP